jgi:hypothetical protein
MCDDLKWLVACLRAHDGLNVGDQAKTKAEFAQSIGAMKFLHPKTTKAPCLQTRGF